MCSSLTGFTPLREIGIATNSNPSALMADAFPLSPATTTTSAPAVRIACARGNRCDRKNQSWLATIRTRRRLFNMPHPPRATEFMECHAGPPTLSWAIARRTLTRGAEGSLSRVPFRSRETMYCALRPLTANLWTASV